MKDAWPVIVLAGGLGTRLRPVGSNCPKMTSLSDGAESRSRPFLTVLAPSELYYQDKHRRHKKLTDWARQMVLQVRRWLPKRGRHRGR